MSQICRLDFQFSPDVEWTLSGLREEGRSAELERWLVRKPLKLAWEWMGFQASSGYASAVGEGAEEGVEERVEEEEVDMGEEGLWSPNSSDRAVLALIPDAPVFLTQ
ncbi:hypothetical protein BDM02DRAFT_3194453 [Thelephora ganbajun]|uniref:Uncharacterized protein n=1 Tax=Thelephora ganbajun TaxID=370292 RepID=A0ACB6YWM5_THEGA|nr:hypothetical protein BDM02DRAFT_3194453 [Thelephora ganbajun]